MRIAGEIRRRIDAGELVPGDRVPSTRGITREWGVAMATASKVLAILTREGLVRPVPGVGTVVAGHGHGHGHGPGSVRTGGPAGPGGASGAPLTRERIVRTAVALADAEGLAAVTMRRVATGLGTSTVALHTHVPGRGELVRLMTDTVLASGEPESAPAGTWRSELASAARWLWRTYNRHPWLAHTMGSLTRPMASPQAMKYAERVLRALKGLGLSPYEMLHVHLTLFGLVQGIAMATELEAQARQDTGMSSDEWMDSHDAHMEAIQARGGYPVLSSLMEDEEDFDLDLDTLFEFALARTLDGVAVFVGSGGP